jgi:putative transposase
MLELTLPQIVKTFSVSKSAAYRLATKKKWEFRFDKISTGGRQKVYIVPDQEIPTKHEVPVKIEPKPVEVLTNDADLIKLVPDEVLNEAELKRAQFKGQLCDIIIEGLEDTKSKTQFWKDIVMAYNNKLIVPELYELEGKKAERTLRLWVKQYSENDCNTDSLIRNYKSCNDKWATEAEKNLLLSFLLDANRIKIGSAIRKLKQMARLKVLESPTSERALRRWCEAWKDEHTETWNLLRNGNKFLKDNGILTLLRRECLNVGDVWVADGHKLAFDILDPKTGKPKRMMLLLFFDWASRYPVGASIANTEDSEQIMLALRNGILNWGARPKFVYLDNGKAFKSKLFHQKWNDHDLEKELSGIFPRLGIQAKFAKAYNTRAKIVERFFKTFQEDFERFMDTFRGGSIADKPAYLMRNEKWIRNLKERNPLTIDEAKCLMAFYFQELYGKTPHGGLKGKNPYDLFINAQLPENQIIEPSRLNFLMLKIKQRTVSNNGIRMNNVLYWDDSLVRYVGKKVMLRYDIMDMRSILVYDEKDNLICQAEMRRLTHPFIDLAPDKELAEKELKQRLKHQRRLEKEVKEKSNQIRLQVEEAVSALPLPNFSLKDGAFNDSRMLEHKTKEEDDFDLDKLLTSQPIIKPKEKTSEELGLEKLDEMLKKIGIE